MNQSIRFQIQTTPTTMSTSELAEAKRAYIKNRLANNFPYCLTFIYAISLITIGNVQISFQAILISKRALNWQICNGIWGGLLCISVALINITLSIFFDFFVYLIINLSNYDFLFY